MKPKDVSHMIASKKFVVWAAALLVAMLAFFLFRAEGWRKEPPPTNLEARALLQWELDREIDAQGGYARRNYATYYVLLVLAIAATGLATIAAADGSTIPKGLRIVATTIPAWIILANNTIKFDAKADWHWAMQRELIKIQRELRFGSGDQVNAIIAKLNEAEDRMSLLWPGFGRLQPGAGESKDSTPSPTPAPPEKTAQ